MHQMRTDGTPPDPEDHSLRLRHAIENKFPYLIARAFYQLRGIDNWQAEIPQLANVLGVTLEHLAIVALSEYLSNPRRDAHLDEQLLQTFQKPLSHGAWAGLLREVLTVLQRQEGYSFFTLQLPELYFSRTRQRGARTIKQVGDDLVQLRNDLLKRTAGAVPNRTEEQRFKRQLTEFLQLLSFLKDYPLVSVKGTRTQSGVKTHVCYLHMGFHDMFDQANLQCDLDLENSYPAMLNPGKSELLYLYPFYVLADCSKPGCGAAHLFHFEKLDKRGIDYVFTGDHRLRDPEAGQHLTALLQGNWDTPLRQQARYLYMQSTETWHQLPVGSRIGGKYEIVEHLRRGGMADVYKVRLVGSDTYLALKLLPFQFLSDRKMVQRFRQETAQARDLEHPNITRVIDDGEDLVDNYIVMELATGWRQSDARIALDVGELAKPIPEQAAVEIIKQACEGLHYIHRQGIVHRDIKPGNLLLFEGGGVKLADFGIARSREAMALTSTGMAMGTPEYMSPEQSEGTKDLTPASDVYSLGVVLYELLSGKPPFKRATPLATVYAHLNAPVPPMETSQGPISLDLQELVLKCLEKDPTKRFQSPRALFKALFEHEELKAEPKPSASQETTPTFGAEEANLVTAPVQQVEEPIDNPSPVALWEATTVALTPDPSTIEPVALVTEVIPQPLEQTAEESLLRAMSDAEPEMTQEPSTVAPEQTTATVTKASITPAATARAAPRHGVWGLGAVLLVALLLISGTIALLSGQSRAIHVGQPTPVTSAIAEPSATSRQAAALQAQVTGTAQAGASATRLVAAYVQASSTAQAVEISTALASSAQATLVTQQEATTVAQAARNATDAQATAGAAAAQATAGAQTAVALSQVLVQSQVQATVTAVAQAQATANSQAAAFQAQQVYRQIARARSMLKPRPTCKQQPVCAHRQSLWGPARRVPRLTQILQPQ